MHQGSLGKVKVLKKICNANKMVHTHCEYFPSTGNKHLFSTMYKRQPQPLEFQIMSFFCYGNSGLKAVFQSEKCPLALKKNLTDKF